MAEEQGIDLEKMIIAKIEELRAECNAIRKDTSGRYKSLFIELFLVHTIKCLAGDSVAVAGLLFFLTSQISQV